MNNLALQVGYDEAAKGYETYHRYDNWGYHLIEEMLQHLTPGGNILDLGCGPGKECRYIAEKGFVPLGIDFSRGMIALARERSPTLGFRILDISNVEEIGWKFDGAIMRSVLLHFARSEVPGVLNSIASMIEKNGWLYLAVKEGEGEEIATDYKYGKPYKRPFTYFQEIEMFKLLKSAGFAVTKAEKHHQVNTVRLQFLAQKR